MAKLGAVFRFIIKRLLLPAGIAIGIATLPVAGAITFLLSPRGNEWLRQNLENYLRQKLHTKVKITQIHFRALNRLVISDFILPDPNKTTLITFRKLSVDIQWKLLWSPDRSIFENVCVEQFNSTIERKSGANNFNWQFVFDAISSRGDKGDANQPDIAWLIPKLVELRDVSIKYRDDQTGSNATLTFSRLSATSHVTNTKYLTVNKLKILKPNFRFTEARKELVIDSQASLIELSDGNFSLEKLSLHTKQLLIDDQFTALTIGKTSTGGETVSEASGLELSIDTLIINRNRFSINLKNASKVSHDGFTPFHNDFKNIDIAATSLHYGQRGLSGRLNRLSFIDSRQFQLDNMNADFYFNDKALHIRNLALTTPHNAIRGNVLWRYSSWKQALVNPETTRFNIVANANTLHLRELAYFIPSLLRYHDIYPLYKQHIQLHVEGSGSPRNIRLDHLDVSTSHNHLVGTGEIHIPEQGDTWLSLEIKNGQSGKHGLLDLISPVIISPVLLQKIPDKVRLKGKIRVDPRSVRGSLSLGSIIGAVHLQGSLSEFSNLSKISYNLAFETRNLHLAQILKDTLLGNVTARGRVIGRGLSEVSTMSLQSNGFVNEINVLGQSIQSIRFDTRLAKGQLSANVSSSHPALNFDLTPTVYLNRPDSLASIFGSVFNADLRKFGFTRDTIMVNGKVSANLVKFTADSLIGNLEVSGADLRFGSIKHHLALLKLNASHPGPNQLLQLESAFADMELSGRLAIRQMPTFISSLVQALLKSKTFPDIKGITSFKMLGNVHLPPEVLTLTTGIPLLAPFNFSSSFERDKGTFEFHSTVDSITIGGITMGSAFLKVNARRNTSTFATETDYIAGAKNLEVSSIRLPHAQIEAGVRDGSHVGKLLSSEATTGSLLRIPFTYNAQQPNPSVYLGDSIYFKGDLWHVNSDNAIYPLATNLAGSNVSLRSGSQSATFTASNAETNGLPYQFQLGRINLRPIFTFIRGDSTFLAGSASGSVSVSNFKPLTLIANIQTQNLKVKGIELGKIDAEVKNDSADRYALTMNVVGASRRIIDAHGTYEPSKGLGALSIELDSLTFAPLGTLLENDIDSLRGTLSGHLDIRNGPQGTSVDGTVGIDSSSFAIRETGSRVQIAAGGFHFKGNKIGLDPILLRDGKGGQATITGSIDITNGHSAHYQFKLNAKHFKAIGSLRHRDQIVHGDGRTDASLELTGQPDQLTLTGQVSLRDSSQIFYRSAAVTRPNFGEGLLEFVTINQKIPSSNALPKSAMRRLINTNITIPSNTTLTLLLDEYRGEKAVVRGRSNLNYSQHAGGEMQLNGKYEVTSGTYTFSVGNNIKKEFALENGGTIQWLGDFYQPICDLTAIYKVNTAAGALMQGTSSNAEAARRKFDFLVKLKLKGNLSKPEISFELGMNETDQDAFDGTVYSKIKQINSSQSDVTKQVMSLLVLNSFMGDSPFGSLNQFSGGAMEAGAYNTIGNLLTRQLNNMLAGMVKAVDITLGVNWSESVENGRSSTRSDIKLGVGKSLFNHRLNLYVGNNFGVETLSGNNSGASGLANDISVEYLLNPEGKYRIKGYHVRDNELTLHGEHMETGVKFSIIWEFDQRETKPGKKETVR